MSTKGEGALSDDELRKKNMAIVQEYIDAINAWDFDKTRELLADDALLEMPYAPPGFDRQIRGKENILAFVETVPSIIDSENLHDVEMHTLYDDPGEIVCTFKSAMEIKPRMTPYENDYISRWTVRDAKVTHFAEYYDPIPLVEALGGSVKPATIEDAASASA
jgi:ketosteroid isomerase-like protein